MPSTLLLTEAFDSVFSIATAKSDAIVVATMLTSRGMCSTLSANLPSYTLNRGISDRMLDFLLENAEENEQEKDEDKSSSSQPTAAFTYATRITLRPLRYESFLRRDDEKEDKKHFFPRITKIATHLKEVRVEATSSGLSQYDPDRRVKIKFPSSSKKKKKEDHDDSTTEKDEDEDEIEEDGSEDKEDENKDFDRFYSNTNKNRILSEQDDLLPLLRLRRLETLKISCSTNLNEDGFLSGVNSRNHDYIIINNNIMPSIFTESSAQQQAWLSASNQQHSNKNYDVDKTIVPFKTLLSHIANPQLPIFFNLRHLDIRGYQDPETHLLSRHLQQQTQMARLGQLQGQQARFGPQQVAMINIPPPPIELLHQMPNLETLILNENSFRGKVSSTFLSKLPKNIKHFSARNNLKLQGKLNFRDLPLGLNYLHLGFCSFQGLQNFEELEDHPSLRSLYLMNNNLSSHLESTISESEENISKSSNNNTPTTTITEETVITTPRILPYQIFTRLPHVLEHLVMHSCNLCLEEDSSPNAIATAANATNNSVRLPSLYQSPTSSSSSTPTSGFPLDLTQLPNSLKTFYIFSNDFGNTLDISQLPNEGNLETFSCENNRFVSELRGLTNLPSSLTGLHLSRNKFSNNFDDPKKFNFLISSSPLNLKILYLNSNQLTNPPDVPLNLKQLPKTLRQLFLQDNLFCGTLDVSELNPGLEYLSLTNNKFDCIVGLDSLVSSLSQLHLRNNKIENKNNDPKLFSKLGDCATSLKILDFSSNRLSGTVDLTNLPESLENLMLSCNPLSHPSPDLSKLPKGLKRLDLRGEPLSDDDDDDNNEKEDENDKSKNNVLQKLKFRVPKFAVNPEIYYNFTPDLNLFELSVSKPEIRKRLSLPAQFSEKEEYGFTWAWDDDRLPNSLKKLPFFDNRHFEEEE